MQKKFFEILVQTALTVGLIWTILELTPKSALLSLTILYFLGMPKVRVWSILTLVMPLVKTEQIQNLALF